MYTSMIGLALGACAAVVSAAPMLEARDACTFSTVEALKLGQAKCKVVTIQDMTVPAGQPLDLLTLQKGAVVWFRGKTTFEFAEWNGPLVQLTGTNVEVNGAPGHTLDGQGSQYWDGKGGSGGKKKPHFFGAHNMVDSSINGLHLQNAPVQFFSIDGANGLGLHGITCDNSAGVALGKNTDAFDVGSSHNVVISGANVINQDDCLAINSGTNIVFKDGKCVGGHGLSIGSVGGRSDNVVSGIQISNSTVQNSANGIRIKTIEGAVGHVHDVTYEDITLENITRFGIVIEQDYKDGSATGNPTGGVPITALTIKNVHGTVAEKAVNVQVRCASSPGTPCNNWNWQDVHVAAPGGSPLLNLASNIDGKNTNVPAVVPTV